MNFPFEKIEQKRIQWTGKLYYCNQLVLRLDKEAISQFKLHINY
jgi:hypothetical protein